MALNFPDSPVTGEKYLASNGVEYIYDAPTDTWTGTTAEGVLPANPGPGDITAVPDFIGGNGTATDPYMISPTCVIPAGGSAESRQLITISNQPSFSIGTWDVLSGTISRFDQPDSVFSNGGQWTGRLLYEDTPTTTVAQLYDGLLKIGTAYIGWKVTQTVNLTTFTPADSPNASPDSVDYPSDSKYGKVTGTYIDTPGPMTATGAAKFTVNNGSPLTSGAIAVNDTLGVLFDETIVNATDEGTTLEGHIHGQGFYCLVPEILVNRSPEEFTIPPITSAATSTPVQSSSFKLTGITCKSYLLIDDANTTLTSVQASMNGGSFIDIPTTGFTCPTNPGDDIIIRGTTGSVALLQYDARIKIGTTTTDWLVTTSSAVPAIQKPVILSPVYGSIDIVPPTDLISSEYIPLNGTSATHASSDWQVYQSDKVAAFTEIITDSTELPGKWNIGTAINSNSEWQSVAYGGGKYVAVSGDGTGTNRAMYSTDGSSWTECTGVPAGSNWMGITYGDGKFVAVASSTVPGGSQVMTSSDGISWNNASAAEANQWQDVTYGGGKFVAVSSGGTNRVMYSTDGVSWTAASAAAASQWQGVTYGNGRFVAVAYSGNNRSMYSTDGITWYVMTGDGGTDNGWMSVTYGNGLFVAVATSAPHQVMYSSDGVSWTFGAGSSSSLWYDIAFGNNTFVVVGTNQVMTSPDAVNWTAVAPADAASWDGVAYGDAAGFVAVANAGTNRVMWSYTGTGNDLTQLTFSSNTHLSLFSQDTAIIESSGGIPITSVIANISNSATGTGWGQFDPNPVNTSIPWGTIGFGGGKFLIASMDASPSIPLVETIMMSIDGKTWINPTSVDGVVGTSGTRWYGLAYGVDTWAAVGASSAGGKGIKSNDGGATWQENGIANASWTDICYGNGQFVAVGWGPTATVGYSADGFVWYEVTGAASGYSDWNSVCWSETESIYLAVGDSGYMHSTNGIAWTFVGTSESRTNWNAVHYANGRFVAVGTAVDGAHGVCWSQNGNSWYNANGASSPSVNSQDWHGVTYVNGVWVASGSNNSTMYSTDDALTWTYVKAGDKAANYYGINSDGTSVYTVSSNNGIAAKDSGKILSLLNDTNLANFKDGDSIDKGKVASVDEDSNQMVVFETGTDWSPQMPLGTGRPYHTSTANGMYFADVGTTDWVYSHDAVNWTLGTPSSTAFSYTNWVYGFNRWYRATGTYNSTQTVESSIDGISWGAGPGGAGGTQGLLCYGNDKLVFVVNLGSTGGGASQSWVSTTGEVNSFVTGGVSDRFGGPSSTVAITYADGIFYVSGSNGEIWSSTDGLSWSLQYTLNPAGYIASLATDGDMVIGCSYQGYSVYKPAGSSSWSSSAAFTDHASNQPRAIGYGDGTWNVVGETSPNGTRELVMWKSTDGLSWTRTTTANMTATVAEWISYDNNAWIMGAQGQVGTMFPNGSYNVGDSVIGSDWGEAYGTVYSTDSSTNNMTVASSVGRWLVTHSDYETDKKLNKYVVDNSGKKTLPIGPPTTEPPSSEYTAVVNKQNDTVNKTTYPLTDQDIYPDKVYYSRVRYNSGDDPAVVSPYSDYNEFITNDVFVGKGGISIVPYDGNSSNNYITGVGFEPDLVWLKSRNFADGHFLFDQIRGPEEYIRSNDAGVELYGNNTTLKSFDSDGFTLGTEGGLNSSGNKFISWNWNAGGETVTNNKGTVPSQVRSNGAFSIVKWNNNSEPCSVGHGLAEEPAFILTKSLTYGSDWAVFHKSSGENGYYMLNSPLYFTSSNNYWVMDDETMQFQRSYNNNELEMIAYCWIEKSGQSAFGSYTGQDNLEVDIGFRPSFVMVKSADTVITSWMMFDEKREVRDGAPGWSAYLQANEGDAEVDQLILEFTDVGFKPGNSVQTGQGGVGYVYVAFAEDRYIPSPCEEYQGGHFAGQIKDNGTIYNLVVAPITYGSLNGQYGGTAATHIQWAASNSDTPDAVSTVYGKTATDAYLGSVAYPMFNWATDVVQGPNAAGGIGIGGYTDWYIPALYELEVCYYNLKPTTTENNQSASGNNPYSVPPRNNAYVPSVPAQTSCPLFQLGGAQAFTADLYWTASQSNASSAWQIHFGTGLQQAIGKDDDPSINNGGGCARAVRRVVS